MRTDRVGRPHHRRAENPHHRHRRWPRLRWANPGDAGLAGTLRRSAATLRQALRGTGPGRAQGRRELLPRSPRRQLPRTRTQFSLIRLMLQLVGVSKSYDGTLALQPTDLTIPSGQTTVLIGPSGCGKSTVLRLMAGLLQPDAGVITFEGVP